jgi:outer membrane protein
MYSFQQIISIFCAGLLLAPAGVAQEPASQSQTSRQQAHQLIHPDGKIASITRPYRAVEVPPISLANTARLESLLRAGKLYLSLQDTIALALENNIDIEIQRYGPQIADAGVLRAQAGGFARGVSTSVQSGPTSVTTGGVAQTGGATSAQASNATSTAVGNTVLTQTGTSIPSLDPVLTGSLRWGHQTTPQSSAFVTGTNYVVQRADTSSFGIQKGFLTGTIASLTMNNNNVTNNNRRADFNPSTNATLGLNISQHLLQGFGRAVNSRQILIAKNNREVSDLTFKLQVITTVAAVMNLYWDLVAFNEDVRVKREALSSSEKLYNDNKKQVEIGTLAPIEVVRAEAEMAARQQDLTISETQVLQQETILKNALSRTGVVSPSVANARVIATDRMRMPDVEPVAPIQDLVSMALSARPELASTRIQLENSRISLKGSRNALLPSLDLVANVANEALAGQVNTLPVLPGSGPRTGSAFFIGGFGTTLSQLFSRNFPDYSVGLSLNIPIRNRAAQADMINDQLTLRQQQLLSQRQENQVRVDVQNALIGLQQARARYQAATKARVLQEQTLDAEQKKYALGASTIYNVILAQRDLSQSQSGEVAALAAYSKARVELDRSTGQVLTSNNISLAEAYQGTVSRPPSPIPAETQ